jgi:hypothetical protein
MLSVLIRSMWRVNTKDLQMWDIFVQFARTATRHHETTRQSMCVRHLACRPVVAEDGLLAARGRAPQPRDNVTLSTLSESELSPETRGDTT